MASCASASACAIQRPLADSVSPLPKPSASSILSRPALRTSLAASRGGQASSTASWSWSSMRQPAGRRCSAATRRPACRTAPRSASQRRAGPGSSSPRSTRGSSRSAPRQWPWPAPNSASCSTRSSTAALACASGVLSADRQSGSISSSITRGGSPAQSPATLRSDGQENPVARQRKLVCSSANRSRQPQPRAPRMAASRSSGAGQRAAHAGTASPEPSA